MTGKSASIGSERSWMTGAAVARSIYFISHPNVVISREVPVPEWPLTDVGRRRMVQGLSQPWLPSVTSIYSSTERKATDGAEILAQHLRLPFTQVPSLERTTAHLQGSCPRMSSRRLPTNSLLGRMSRFEAGSAQLTLRSGLPTR